MDPAYVEIHLKWFDVPDNALALDVLEPAASASKKREMVERLTGAPIPENVKPIDAYLDFLCRLNRIPEGTRPLPRELADAIIEERGAHQFLFWLA